MSPRPFQDLTRRERLHRYRQLAKVALRAYGLEGARLTFLQYGENVIYRVNLPTTAIQDDSQMPYLHNRALLRLHAWDNIPYINSEMIWLDALRNESRIIVPRPIRTLDGKFSIQADCPHEQVKRCATLLSWLDGRKLNKGLRPKHLHDLGRVMAQLHNFTAAWEPPKDFKRPDWDWESQLGGSHFSSSLAELLATVPTRFQAPFKTISQEAKEAMTRLGKGTDAYGLIHADLYPENVLFKAGKAYPIDFEDCGYGYWIWDIAVALCTWAWEPNWKRMRDAFITGYQSERILPAEQWSLLDLFIAAQYATMLIWSSAFLLHDPNRANEYCPWRDDSGEKMLRYFT